MTKNKDKKRDKLIFSPSLPTLRAYEKSNTKFYKKDS